MDALLNELMKQTGLGGMTAQPQRVSGGYLHRMYRVETAASTYAVKCLNPEIMARPEAMGNYRHAEVLEQELEDAGLPIVPALRLQGKKMQAVQGRYFYIFPWVDAKALAWEDITAEHCRIMGDLLARIHLLRRREEAPAMEPVREDWDALIGKAEALHSPLAEALHSPLAEALSQGKALLRQAEEALHQAQDGLNAVTCISNADMDCKNVLWRGMEPLVIDLECLDWGHPLWDMFQLALSWAGGAVGEIDGKRLAAFLGAYLARWGEPGMELTALWGAGFSWLEWLAYNVRRALGLIPGDEEEHSLGEKEALATLQRIEGHARSHDKVIRLLLVLQHGVENAI